MYVLPYDVTDRDEQYTVKEVLLEPDERPVEVSDVTYLRVMGESA